ncbi:hypothetical protein M3O96_10905 [Aquiflexum sp. TKW24L]|uniref:hypothetical protein n=1 Tax=Aquiflexum sp. TKW24L TaxID=2942212 RepID=UPI0020BDB397|nr:hypothetical protein [Aquiflexum sp. TKW24L]MCL6259602.1 hypothetical protein [Aquiflexum sp. TKW24L]
MNFNVEYGLSNGIRLFVCTMAVFFTLLAVLGSFEKKAELIYAGEFVSEVEFKFIEFPNTLQFPSSNKISKIERIEFIQPVQRAVYTVLDSPKFKIKSVAETVHIFFPIRFLFKYSLNTHAP